SLYAARMTSSVAPSQSLPQEVTSVRSGTLYAVVSEQFLMDSNIFDKIVDTPGALQLVETLVADGKVELLVTHVQEDELARIPDEQRRQRVALVPRTIAPTYGFVLNMSRLGMARFGEAAAPIE